MWPFDGSLDWVGVLVVHTVYLCAHWLTRVQVGGARGERLVETRYAWMLQRPLFECAPPRTYPYIFVPALTPTLAPACVFLPFCTHRRSELVLAHQPMQMHAQPTLP